MIEKDTLQEIGEHLKIIHHIPGRIRLRINPGILKNTSRSELTSVVESINGIIETRINFTAASVVVTYDKKVFSPELWKKWIENNEIDDVYKVVN